MRLIFSKIKQSRIAIGFNQKQAADQTNLTQSQISEMESGKREFLYPEYMEFLFEKGLDMNSLFNINTTDIELRDIPVNNIQEEESIYIKIEDKDKQIIELKGQIKLLKELLQEKHQSKSKSA